MFGQPPREGSLQSLTRVDQLALVVQGIDAFQRGRDIRRQRMLRARLELLYELVVVRLVELEDEVVLVTHPRDTSSYRISLSRIRPVSAGSFPGRLMRGRSMPARTRAWILSRHSSTLPTMVVDSSMRSETAAAAPSASRFSQAARMAATSFSKPLRCSIW